MILDLNSELENKKRQKKVENVRKWRKENPEKYKKIQKKAMLKYRLKNAKKFSQNSLNYYYRNREEVLRKSKERRQKLKNKMEENI